MQAFEYEPLPPKGHIRVLTVLPDLSKKGLIQCTIRHTTIDDAYICLSYTWGEPTTNPDHVLLNGTKVPVRDNLYAFLLIARKKFHSQPLWIDVSAYIQLANLNTLPEKCIGGCHIQ
jgi:hypothetical protein